jgi:GWxTD domain-containing protein
MNGHSVRILLFVTLAIWTVQAQTQTKVGGVGQFRLDVDYARFAGTDTLAYVEVYFSINESSLSYEKSNGVFSGGAVFAARIRNDEGRLVEENQWFAPSVLKDTSHLSSGDNIVGVTKFFLPPGQYACDILARDQHSPHRKDSISFPLRIGNFPTHLLSASDLELCTSVRRIDRDTSNIFYKNTLEVVPNPSGVFGGAIPMLFFYAETYNLSVIPADEYSVGIIVHDAFGNEILRQERTKENRRNSTVEIGSVNVRQFRGGTYTLTMVIHDTVTNTAISSSKKFFVYRPGEPVDSNFVIASQGTLHTEFSGMTETELDSDLVKSAYIATDQELKQYRDLGAIQHAGDRLTAKRNFLFNFWERRGRTESGGVKRSRQEYLRRLSYVDERFSWAYRKGWQTDRGRVYLKYGESNEIERYPNTIDNNPYEIWSYHQMEGQGGVIFVFVDRTGFGDWVLVHSTHRGEIHDEGWSRYIRK